MAALDALAQDAAKRGREGYVARRGHQRPRCSMPVVVVLSAYHDRERVMKALDLGALGFIPKSAPRRRRSAQ